MEKEMKFKIVLPIFGFEGYKEAILNKIDDFFYELIIGEFSFLLLDAKSIREYEFLISEVQKEKLKINNPNDIQIFNIVTLKNPIKESTVNFLAPILVNKKEKLLGQIILDDQKYKNYGLKEKIKKYL